METPLLFPKTEGLQGCPVAKEGNSSMNSTLDVESAGNEGLVRRGGEYDG